MSEFVIAGRDATELLDATEESLDEVAGFVLLPVELARRESVATWRNDCLGASLGNRIHESVAVVPLVGNNSIARNGINQCRPLGNVGDLSSRENQAQRITPCIHTSVNLGRQSATRAADRLIATVFLGAPAECW